MKIKVGSRIKLKEDVKMYDRTYSKGHEFNVVDYNYPRGFDLEDDDGNRIDECLFIHDKLELIN